MIDLVLPALCLISAVAALDALWSMRKYRNEPGARYWSGFIFAIMLWSVSYGAGLLVFDEQVRSLFEIGIWVGKNLCPPTMLGIALSYTGRRELAYSRLMTANGIFWISAALVYATTPIYHHQLVWTQYEISSVLGAATVTYTRQPLLFVFYAIAYLQIGLGVVLLLETLYRYGSNYRTQIVGVVVALGAPTTTSMIWLFQLGPFPQLNVTPIMFAGSVLVITPILFQNETFEVSPTIVRSEAIESLPDPFLAVDSESHLADFNSAAARLVDDIDETQINTRLDEILPELATELNAEEDFTTELELNHEGDTRYFDVNASPYRGPRGRKRGIQIVLREITRRKEREQELSEANEQLEQFASVISHDLRNPINVAKGHTELARETGSEESFEKIDASLARMEAIIRNVLSLAQQGEIVGETEKVHLESVAREAWEHVPTREATLIVEDDMHFVADPDRLLQLFENCFRNALDHVGEDVTVTVGIENDCFYIEDDGPGIPEDEQELIFESGHTTATEGTGLGLAIVTEIADAHGWDVSVSEDNDRGAKFVFCGIEKITHERKK